jgi:hypothetical protein
MAAQVEAAPDHQVSLTDPDARSMNSSGCGTVLADRGYMNGEQVLECEGTGILPCVPRTDTSGKAQRGLFTKADFAYDANHDHYTCPAGEHLTKARARSDHHGDIDLTAT